jgi:hypothetical protein
MTSPWLPALPATLPASPCHSNTLSRESERPCPLHRGPGGKQARHGIAQYVILGAGLDTFAQRRLRDAGLVTSQWHDAEGQRARRYYSITEAGRQAVTEFRADWAQFSATVGNVLSHAPARAGAAGKGRQR